jgi:hypothetical protein
MPSYAHLATVWNHELHTCGCTPSHHQYPLVGQKGDLDNECVRVQGGVARACLPLLPFAAHSSHTHTVLLISWSMLNIDIQSACCTTRLLQQQLIIQFNDDTITMAKTQSLSAHQQKHPAQVARRNARERNRVREVGHRLRHLCTSLEIYFEDS